MQFKPNQNDLSPTGIVGSENAQNIKEVVEEEKADHPSSGNFTFDKSENMIDLVIIANEIEFICNVDRPECNSPI